MLVEVDVAAQKVVDKWPSKYNNIYQAILTETSKRDNIAIKSRSAFQRNVRYLGGMSIIFRM